MGRVAEGRRAAARRRMRRNRAGMLVITMVVCVLFVVLFAAGLRMRKQILANDLRRQELQEAIAAEEDRADKAEDVRAYMQSEEFIRKTAHEKLGLVGEDEVIFVPSN